MNTMEKPLADFIDGENLRFTSRVKSHLSDLARFDLASLEWLMVEHYQFSNRNTTFLADAAKTAESFSTPGVTAELRRNLAEESGHARMYRRALLEIGIDTEQRKPFSPTAEFFETLSTLVAPEPSTMLGAMYATETAAIFEHEVFRDISREIMQRREIVWEGARLKYFHDMHLSGVEQSHKDELGVFLKIPLAATGVGEDASINPVVAHEGARSAILAMTKWWNSLLDNLQPAAAA
jgi:hypothetical protein